MQPVNPDTPGIEFPRSKAKAQEGRHLQNQGRVEDRRRQKKPPGSGEADILPRLRAGQIQVIAW